ncbi:MAG: S-layer homology domain-containing protein [Oscillospiraceae bacterium]|nr:S-layer homology domain-containing protein [Oscillospiraceae bacterium]
MKRTAAKTAALVMAAMIAGTTCVPMTISAYNTASTTSDTSQVAMKEALTIVKKRVTIPEELSEFDYTSYENRSTRTFRFTWTTPDNASVYRRIEVIITGGIITEYYDSKEESHRTNSPELAKLSDEQLLKKAKAYIKQLNPSIADKVKLDITTLSLFSNRVRIDFKRYENGILVDGNNGTVDIDKNTGELKNFYVSWWENAEFANPTGAETEKDIQEAYKSLCKLTPYYKIYTEYVYDEETGRNESERKVNIVYDSDMHEEIDAFTGKKSTIWEDMKAAEGTRYYDMYGDYDDAVTEDSDAGAEAGAEEELGFTEAELEKIKQDENLIKTDEAFEMLKKDKFVALTDDYVLKGYDVGYETDEKTKEETFYLSLRYTVKDELKENYKGYRNLNVRINGVTGEVVYLNRYGNTAELPKLDVAKANAVANDAAKTYAKDIISGYRASENNTAPVESWKSGDKTHYETSRTFSFNRYVNKIMVWNDEINVTVDSNGVVTSYSVNHTDDVVFPSADILSVSEAFDKLYTQQDFDYYYDGWITKDGKVKTYLVYKMDNFYLNAKTGKLCSRNGSNTYQYIAPEDVKYSDIKGIKQKEAILALQKYGIVLTTDIKFRPNDIISESEFAGLMANVLGGYEVAVEEEMIEVGISKDEEKKKLEAAEKDRAETTMREAAVMFGQIYLPADVAKMNIFKSPFSDVKDSDKDAGYLAVANEKGFVTGTNGKIGGENTITRAEAVQIMYDYLKKISK